MGISKTKGFKSVIGKTIFDDNRNMLYVYLPINNTIYPYNITSNEIPGDMIDVGNDPFSMAFDEIRSLLYVANTLDNTISIIDANKNTNLGSPVHVGIYPNDIALDEQENKVFVINSNIIDLASSGNGTVNIISINGSAYKSVNSTVGLIPTSIAVNENNKKIYVSNSGDNTVSVLNYDGKLIKTVPVGSHPVDIAVNSFDGFVYVANSFDSSISIINSSIDEVIQNLTVGNDPNYILVQNTAYGKFFVVNSLSNTVSVVEIDNQTTNEFLIK